MMNFLITLQTVALRPPSFRQILELIYPNTSDINALWYFA